MAVVDDVGATLLRAASDVLASEGAGALTVRRIAQDAGVSTMNVYSRFGGKDGVVEHLYKTGFDRLREAMDLPMTDDPVGDLRDAAVGYRRFATEHPTYYAVMFDRAVPDFEPSADAKAHAAETLGMLAARIARAIDAGALAPGDPMVLAGAMWSACHGVVSLELKSVGPDGLDWAAVHRTLNEALLAGLRQS
jgi:AcrR family transcriptional regulator